MKRYGIGIYTHKMQESEIGNYYLVDETDAEITKLKDSLARLTHLEKVLTSSTMHIEGIREAQREKMKILAPYEYKQDKED